MSNTASATTDNPATGESETIGVRLPTHLIDALKAKRAAMAKVSPGVSITTSDAVRALLLAGLAAEGA